VNLVPESECRQGRIRAPVCLMVHANRVSRVELKYHDIFDVFKIFPLYNFSSNAV